MVCELSSAAALTSLSLSSADKKVLSLALDASGNWLACSFDDKTIQTWNRVESGAWEDAGICKTAKKVDRMLIVPGNSRQSLALLAADRFGNVSARELPLKKEESSVDEKDEEDGVLGHFGGITDVIVDVEKGVIVTSDRDERIRVSNWPNTYDIQSFCLGHSGFVSRIAFVPSDSELLIASGGVDGTLRLWNGRSGVELSCLRLRGEERKSVSQGMVQDLVFHPKAQCLLVLVRGSKSLIRVDIVDHTLVSTDVYSFSEHPLHMTVDCENRIWILTERNELVCLEFSPQGNLEPNKIPSENINSAISKAIGSEEGAPSITDSLIAELENEKIRELKKKSKLA